MLSDRDSRREGSTPGRDIFLKTSAFLTALLKAGCSIPLHEPTVRLPLDQKEWEKEQAHLASLKRGYVDAGLPKCEGRLLFGRSFGEEKPFIKYILSLTCVLVV